MKIYRLYGLNSGEYCQWCRELWDEDRSKWEWELSDEPRRDDTGLYQLRAKLLGQPALTFVILKIHEDKDVLLFETTFKGIGTAYEELCPSCFKQGKVTVR